MDRLDPVGVKDLDRRIGVSQCLPGPLFHRPRNPAGTPPGRVACHSTPAFGFVFFRTYDAMDRWGCLAALKPSAGSHLARPNGAHQGRRALTMG